MMNPDAQLSPAIAHRLNTFARAMFAVFVLVSVLHVNECIAETDTSGQKEQAEQHSPELVFSSGIALYLSDSRTQGGFGPGIGLRYSLSPMAYIQGDFSHRIMLGNAAEVRVEVGIQRRGLWTPSLGVFTSALFGDRLTFLDETHPLPSLGPAIAGGVSGSLLRFRDAGVCVSALELDAGIGLEDGLPGFLIRMTLVELGLIW